MSNYKPVKKTNSIYSVGLAKQSHSPEQRAKGILVLTELGFATFPNFMSGVLK